MNGKPLMTARFGLHGPRDLLDKLKHDTERFQQSITVGRRDVAYAAFDCAVTAWSLVDWVYEFIPEEHRRRLGAVAQDGEREWDKKRGFTKCLKERIHGLEFCRQLATGAKHFLVTSNPDANLRTTIIQLGSYDRGKSGEERLTNLQHLPYIGTAAGHRGADNLFPEIHFQWRRFLNDEGIDIRADRPAISPSLDTHLHRYPSPPNRR